MSNLVFGIILASLPVLSYFLQKKMSQKNNQLKIFERHWLVRYADWLFVPFNFIFIYVVEFVFIQAVVILIISVILNIVLHRYWGSLSANSDSCHFYDKNSDKLTVAGYVHFVFSTIETAMVIMFLLYAASNIFTYFGLFLLALIASSFIVNSYKMHHRPLLTDLGTAVILYVLIIIKVYSLMLTK